MTLDADPSVMQALRADVTNSQLQLTTTAPGFTTNAPIRLVITAPPDALESVQVLSPMATVLVQEGFVADSFAATHTGAGGLYVLGINASDVTLSAAGYAA